MRPGAFCRLGGVILTICGLLSSPNVFPKDTQESAPPPALAAPQEPRSPETVVAKTAWGDITMRDLVDYYGKYLYPSGNAPVEPLVLPDRVPEMPANWLDRLAKVLAIAQTAEKEADKVTDPDRIAKYQKSFNSWLLSYALPEVKKRKVEVRITDPTQPEVKGYYEKHKLEFRQPFQFSMRHIYLATYEPYTTQRGDTLESVAEKISGDRSKANLILSNVEGNPSRWVSPEQAEKKQRLPKEVSVGEHLLVPMSPANAKAVRRRMEEIQGKIKNGEPFEILAKNYSEAETKDEVIGPFPSGVGAGRNVLPEIVETAKKTAVGQISPIIATRHGFHLIQITEKKEEGTKPLEEATPDIMKILRNKQEEQAFKDLNNELYAMPQLKINYDNFAKAPKLSDDAVMVEVADQKFVWKDFNSTFIRWIGEGAGKERILSGIKRNGDVQYALALIWCKDHQIFEEPEMKLKYKALRTGVIAATHIKIQMEDFAVQSITEPAIAQFYEEHKKEQFRIKLRAGFQVIEEKLGPEWNQKPDAEKDAELGRILEEFRRTLQGVKNIHDFIALADRINRPDPGEPPLRVATPIEVEGMPGITGEWVQKLKAGQWSDPYIEGGRIRAVAVTDRLESDFMPLAQVKNAVVKTLVDRAKQDATPVLEQGWLRLAQYQFLLNDEKKKDGK